MKFDYIIIGGGLCGLSAGIRLAEQGKKTAIVSSGQSALHFCAGSLGLLGKNGDKPVTNPLEEIKNLPENHPYSLIGVENVTKLAESAPEFLGNAGITTLGDSSKNHYTLTPFGVYRASWLTLQGYPAFKSDEKLPFEKAVIITLHGFLESYPSFMADNLEKLGVKCKIETLDLDRLARLRKSNFDMRAVSVARQINSETIDEFANKINSVTPDGYTVLIPAVIGFNDEKQFSRLKELVKNPLFCVPTIPVSVSGVRTQHMLQKYFENLGGTYLLGDHVDKGIIENGEVKELLTANFGEDHLQADAYILASGSLFSEGIKSNFNGFYEPVFGLDIYFDENREDWCERDFFGNQPYMNYGVEVDKEFHPKVNGKAIGNLYAAGATLAHCNALKEDSGAGTAILTGMHVADLAMKNVAR